MKWRVITEDVIIEADTAEDAMADATQRELPKDALRELAPLEFEAWYKAKQKQTISRSKKMWASMAWKHAYDSGFLAGELASDEHHIGPELPSSSEPPP